MGRIAAIDFGTARIGLAISDERRIIATPLKFIPAGKTLQDSATKILQILNSYKVEAIVLGLPLHLNGKDSPMSLTIREFAKVLEEMFQIPVHLWDERLTSSQAERLLKSAEVSRKKRVGITDSLSAMILLESYISNIQR